MVFRVLFNYFINIANCLCEKKIFLHKNKLEKNCGRCQVSEISEAIYSNIPFMQPSCKTWWGTKNHASIYYLTIKEIIDEHYGIDVIFQIYAILSNAVNV